MGDGVQVLYSQSTWLCMGDGNTGSTARTPGFESCFCFLTSIMCLTFLHLQCLNQQHHEDL